MIEKGDLVRIWTGDRYEVGRVQSLGRTGLTIKVAISRGEGRRRKLFVVPRDRAVLV